MSLEYTFTSQGIITPIPDGHMSDPLAAMQLAGALTKLYGVSVSVVSAAPGADVEPQGPLAYLAVSIPSVADGSQALPINAGVLLGQIQGQGSWQRDGNSQPVWIQLAPSPSVEVAASNPPNTFPGFPGSTTAVDPNAKMRSQVNDIWQFVMAAKTAAGQ